MLCLAEALSWSIACRIVGGQGRTEGFCSGESEKQATPHKGGRKKEGENTLHQDIRKDKDIKTNLQKNIKIPR